MASTPAVRHGISTGVRDLLGDDVNTIPKEAE
jgi:hypothetical protein